MLRNVVLPDPDGPISETKSPRADVQRQVLDSAAVSISPVR